MSMSMSMLISLQEPKPEPMGILHLISCQYFICLIKGYSLSFSNPPCLRKYGHYYYFMISVPEPNISQKHSIN